MKKVLFLLVAFISAHAKAIDISVLSSGLMIEDASCDSINITITGPSNFQKSFNINKQQIYISTSDLGVLVDGSYQFEAMAITLNGFEEVSDNNGRENAFHSNVRSQTLSGYFDVTAGAINVVDNAISE